MDHQGALKKILSDRSSQGYLTHRESSTVEYKESFDLGNRADYMKAMQSYANTKGGYLNPIEKMWSKAKTMLRAAKARTADELFEAIGTALDKVTPRDAKGWFRHCGVAMIG